MPRTTTGRLAASLTIAIVLLGLTLSSVLARGNDLAAVKAGTARFHNVEQAIAAGYALPAEGPLHECIASTGGAMGYHYINGALLSGDEAAVADPARPEALVYAPDKHGKLRLVAVEYVIFQSDMPSQPTLFGEPFMDMAVNPFGLPPFWALHAWVWEENPVDTFAPFNPAVSC
jgi:hypothetical protein